MYSSSILKNFMDQKGISIEKLALDLNLSEEEAKQCCNNLFEADIDVLILLADYLDISVDYLMGRIDNPDSHKKKLVSL
ncbi:MAG: helix-turn-helix domain-containing protein [Oscillospiraceae bacterium]|jgi:transcriptional regulator with XRE-family HTH domain|nr:helix-turn-helix transcriptional regulator [Oscillospiraceae bacterium]MBS6316204.1 helix-turn-helix transcriptional regulator [Ruminococcus sp.]